jgi:hypothetical protein
MSTQPGRIINARKPQRRNGGRMKLKLACAVVCFHLTALSALAQMGTQQEALRGMSSVWVSVQSADKTVITDDRLRVQVELRLRRAGITVKGCNADTICLPQLYVKVIPIRTSPDLTFCLIKVECNMGVAPIGEPNRRLWATVWLDENAIIALKNDYGPVTVGIDDLIDKFANDYLAANPKPRP